MSEFSPRTSVADNPIYSGQEQSNQVYGTAPSTSGHHAMQEVGSFVTLKEERRWTGKAFDEQLLQATSKLPLTDTAVELLDYVKGIHRYDAIGLANLISRDPKLTALLMWIANTSVYNRSGRPLSNITDAIAQAGIKRISELAVGASFINLAHPPSVLGFDAHLAQRRSLAAVLSADHVLQWHKTSNECHGLLLCALLAPWGRMLTGTAFPEVYQPLLVESHRSQRPLLALEQELFPRSPSSAMAHVLTASGVSPEVCRPLDQADLPFSQLARLDASIQTRVQILKSALLLGEFAVGQWLPWDEISFPTNMQLREIGAGAPRAIVDLVRAQLQEVAHLATLTLSAPNSGQPFVAEAAPELPYGNLALEVGELLPCLLQSMGFQVLQSTIDDPQAKSGMLINCLHTPISWLAAKARDTPHSGWVMLTTEDYPPSWNWLGTFFQTPASYQSIRNTCDRIAPRQNRGPTNQGIPTHQPSTERQPPTNPAQQPAAPPDHSASRHSAPTNSQPAQNPATYEPLNADA